ncbi:MAG TPA: hypothetical protein VMF67_04875 [Rhizomicrobium sp.]|nr:hypothetical protein [Rhizomicrobium sp.]
MSSLRSILVAASVVVASTSAYAAQSSYIASDWNDLVSKVNCKDVKQLPDGQWQIHADVSFAGNIKASPFVPDQHVDALKKRCGMANTPAGQ